MPLQSTPLPTPASVLQLQQLLAAQSQYKAQMLHNNQLHQSIIAQRLQLQLQQASKHSHALLSRDQNETRQSSLDSQTAQTRQPESETEPTQTPMSHNESSGGIWKLADMAKNQKNTQNDQNDENYNSE